MTPPPPSPIDGAVIHDVIRYIDADATEWKDNEPGSRRRTLHFDPVTKRRILLVQWDPGYTISYLDTHDHDEFLYILSGTFVDQNRACGPGTFVHNEPGSSHQPTTPDGCTYLAIISPRFTGAPPADGTGEER